jgi:hypothetical protein
MRNFFYKIFLNTASLSKRLVLRFIPYDWVNFPKCNFYILDIYQWGLLDHQHTFFQCLL